MTTDLYGSIKVLAVLTSAIFAIAQYYENRQKKLIDEGKKETENVGFPSADRNEEIKGYKKRWDTIQNKKPLNNHKIIPTLWGLILSYVILLPFILMVSILPEFFKSFPFKVFSTVEIIYLCFVGASSILIWTSIKLTISLIDMRKQLMAFQEDIEKIKEYDILKKTFQQLNIL